MYLPLDLCKKHLNVEADYHDDDQYIMMLADVAEQAVLVHCNETEEKLIEKGGGCFPSPIINAMLLMLGHLYQNREIVGTKTAELPLSYEYLIRLYQNYNR